MRISDWSSDVCSSDLAKLRLLEAMRSRDRLAWDNPRLAAMDIQWSDVRPERGLYHRLVAAGAVERLGTDDAIVRAAGAPPPDTRDRQSVGSGQSVYVRVDLGGSRILNKNTHHK